MPPALTMSSTHTPRTLRDCSQKLWAAIARDSLALSPLPATWLPLAPPPGFRVWSDDYSNVLSVFRWRR